MMNPPVVVGPSWTIPVAILCVLLVAFGALVAIAAPTDGQTGMVLYPAYFFGFVGCLLCLVVGSSSQKGVLALCMVVLIGVAAGGIVLFVRAADRIYAERDANKQSETGSSSGQTPPSTQ